MALGCGASGAARRSQVPRRDCAVRARTSGIALNVSRLVDSRPIRSLWSSASASLHCSLFSPDAPAFPLPRVIHALTSAFYAGDGAVSTIGDVLRATADVAPRGREGIDPQFLSTLAQDCISGSMLKVLVAKGDAMTAGAAGIKVRHAASGWIEAQGALPDLTPPIASIAALYPERISPLSPPCSSLR